uniref:Uncharacterized protein n=1 Tax=Acrobeloides nanus TaxID=290746 RepID=A0A914DCY1_9BILA
MYGPKDMIASHYFSLSCKMNITRLSSLSIKRPFAQQACAHTHAEHHDSQPKTIKIGTNEYPAETMEKIKLLNKLSKNNVWDDQHGKPRVLCFGEDRKAAHSIHTWFLDVRIF